MLRRLGFARGSLDRRRRGGAWRRADGLRSRGPRGARGIFQRWRLGVRARRVVLEHVGQLAHDGVARGAQLAQYLAHGAENLGQALGAEHDQRDR